MTGQVNAMRAGRARRASRLSYPRAFCAIVLLLSAAFVRADLPRPENRYVNDFADVIDDGDESAIREMLAGVLEESGVEATVVAIDAMSDYVPGQTIESFATRLFNAWGVGDAVRNDGVLILIAVSDRASRIELGRGYGNFRDSAMQAVMDRYMLPEFREGQYGSGLRWGAAAVVAELTGDWPEELSFAARARHRIGHARDELGSGVVLILATGVLAALGILGAAGYRYAARHRARRCPDCGAALVRLDEQADDVHLDSGQRVEETLRSVDYDVWRCPECNEHLLLRYPALFTSYSDCPQCGCRTVRSSSRLLASATYDSTGRKAIRKDCTHCDYEAERIIVTPKRTRSSSSGVSSSGASSGSSFSGGGSFGGGSSSGGGASGRW